MRRGNFEEDCAIGWVPRSTFLLNAKLGIQKDSQETRPQTAMTRRKMRGIAAEATRSRVFAAISKTRVVAERENLINARDSFKSCSRSCRTTQSPWDFFERCGTGMGWHQVLSCTCAWNTRRQMFFEVHRERRRR